MGLFPISVCNQDAGLWRKRINFCKRRYNVAVTSSKQTRISFTAGPGCTAHEPEIYSKAGQSRYGQCKTPDFNHKKGVSQVLWVSSQPTTARQRDGWGRGAAGQGASQTPSQPLRFRSTGQSQTQTANSQILRRQSRTRGGRSRILGGGSRTAAGRFRTLSGLF